MCLLSLDSWWLLVDMETLEHCKRPCDYADVTVVFAHVVGMHFSGMFEVTTHPCRVTQKMGTHSFEVVLDAHEEPMDEIQVTREGIPMNPEYACYQWSPIEDISAPVQVTVHEQKGSSDSLFFGPLSVSN